MCVNFSVKYRHECQRNVYEGIAAIGIDQRDSRNVNYRQPEAGNASAFTIPLSGLLPRTFSAVISRPSQIKFAVTKETCLVMFSHLLTSFIPDRLHASIPCIHMYTQTHTGYLIHVLPILFPHTAESAAASFPIPCLSFSHFPAPRRVRPRSSSLT
jgi:hypothetical protein